MLVLTFVADGSKLAVVTRASISPLANPSMKTPTNPVMVTSPRAVQCPVMKLWTSKVATVRRRGPPAGYAALFAT